MPAADRVRPYEHLSDQELWNLSGEAADLRLRLAMLSPGEVMETLVRHGCPKKAALRQVQDPQLRGFAARFHIDVADAALGNPEARARMEHVITGWDRLRAAGAEE
jgi:hypothetical protein